MLQQLRDNKQFTVFPLDKNLGSCILEYEEYIKRVFSDHLLDTNTYQQLQSNKAQAAVNDTYNQIDAFIINHGEFINRDNQIYVDWSTKVEDPLSYFYITAKVHKTPWSTRPIVYVAGSLTHGLGHWLDQQLQPICKKLPSYLKSSLKLKQKLNALTLDTSRIRFFTADATSMYTNIDTDHALEKNASFLRTPPPRFWHQC